MCNTQSSQHFVEISQTQNQHLVAESPVLPLWRASPPSNSPATYQQKSYPLFKYHNHNTITIRNNLWTNWPASVPAFDGGERGLLPVAVLAFRQGCRPCSIVHAPILWQHMNCFSIMKVKSHESVKTLLPLKLIFTVIRHFSPASDWLRPQVPYWALVLDPMGLLSPDSLT